MKRLVNPLSIGLIISLVVNIILIVVVSGGSEPQGATKTDQPAAQKPSADSDEGSARQQSLRKTFYEQGRAELSLLRTIAAKEGAESTVETIDRFIENKDRWLQGSDPAKRLDRKRARTDRLRQRDRSLTQKRKAKRYSTPKQDPNRADQ